MAGASRLLGTSRAFQSSHHPSSHASSSSTCSSTLSFDQGGVGTEKDKKLKEISTLRRRTRLAVSNLELDVYTTAAAAAVIPSPNKQQHKACKAKDKCAFLEVQLDTTSPRPISLPSQLLPPAVSNTSVWRSLKVEMLIEKGVIGCQSFTLIAVAGSLIGSILCFVEGCYLVLQSFLIYFQTISQRVDQGGIIELLVEAIDMFLVGTALLTFGMSMYVMFIASHKMKQGKRCPAAASNSNLFGLFNFERLSDSMGMHSISQAKSKIGHAVVLILQTGVMEKVKAVSLMSSFDLACFAGAVLISSACVFLLSKLTVPDKQN